MTNTYPDPMAPPTTLTAAERATARQMASADPTWLETAIEAALTHCEDRAELIQRVIQETRR